MNNVRTSPTPALTRFAGRAGDHNDRAMVASGLLTSALASRLSMEPITIGAPRPALCTDWSEELDSAREELTEMASHYQFLMERHRRPVTALSRCAVALATLPVVAEHRPDAVVVWFDAHADLNTPGNTTTGYLGGLALSGPLGLWDSGLGSGLSTGNAILVGTRDVDPAERELLDTSEIGLVAPGPNVATELRMAVAGRPVYVHIDCDVLEPGIVPTDYAVPHGLSLGDLHAACAVLADSEIVGVEIGELESVSGDEDLAPFLAALEPVLDAIQAGS